MEAKFSNGSKRQKINKMNSTMLDNFKELKNNNDIVRSNAGVALINYLCQQNMDQTDKELNYALTRLVRSLGSSTVFARKGFYSTLTVFLTTYPAISIEKLLSIMNTQLHPTASNSKRENADIYMGRTLLCGALIRSKLLIQSTIEIQQQVIEILLNAGRQRSYLSLVSIMFLDEFIIQLDIESMKKIVWPTVEKEFGKPWSEQTLDSFYVLLVVREKYPSLVDHKFLKKHLGIKDILAKESIEDIIKLLMAPHRIVSYRHPVFKLFCDKLTSTELIVDFWRKIDEKFTKPSKNDEYIAIQILGLILPNVTDKTIIPSLLSPNFLCHMLKRFSNCKKNNNDDIFIAFRQVLHLLVSATSDKGIKTKTQLSILKKLVLHPGDLMIEKKTGTKVIQIITGNLRLDGIKKLCQLYRDIVENKMSKEREDIKIELWTNAERSYAAHLLTRLMGHPETLSDQSWRLAQLIFLFNYGLCEIANVGIELAPQFKDSFYRAVDYKLPKLNDVRKLLSAFVHDLNSKLQTNAIQLRSPLSDKTFDAWKRVMDFIEKLEKNTKNTEALPIFHTMNLHMGLQLFSDPEMAITSINELGCCYERLIKKSKEHTRVNNVAVEMEPHWVEVIVDLLLSFLSRNNHLLRSLVGCVFPHICPYLTPFAVYQILTILNIKNGRNPLTAKENDNEDSSSDTEGESDNVTEESVSNYATSSEESELESDDENVDGDETLTDRLRIAVRQALGDPATQTDDEDIDVDEMDDDEAERLDESLATAFKILRENRQSRSKKQEKTSQTLTHFRIRVIDLLDIYLETCPSMAITLNIIVPLFALLEFCIKDPHQKPLEHRVRACLKKLSTIKRFNDTTGVENSLLTTVLKALMEKGERSVSVCQEMNDKLAECCTFLVRCMQQANLSTESVIKIYIENLTSFFKKRDCVLSSLLFKGVLQLCWEGNWQLAPVLVDFAFDSNIRYFRRSQALELLLIFYNNRLLRTDTKYTDKNNMRMKLETTLYSNIICAFQELCNLSASDNGRSISHDGTDIQKKVRQKFICLLFTLLRVIYAHHVPQAWNWQNIKAALITYKSQHIFSKDAKSAYNKLAMQIGIPLKISSMRSNTDVSNKSTDAASRSNGKEDTGSEDRKTSVSEEETSHGNNVSKKRKKNKKKDKQMLKKEARELRVKVMSKDLKLFNFSSVILPENQIDETEIQNGSSHDEFSNLKSSQKRTHGQTKKDSESKKRKSVHCT